MKLGALSYLCELLSCYNFESSADCFTKEGTHAGTPLSRKIHRYCGLQVLNLGGMSHSAIHFLAEGQ